MPNNKKECEVYFFGDVEVMDNGKKKVHAKGIKPKYMTKGAACADCFLTEDVTVPKRSTLKIPLYIGFEIRKGYCVKIYPRSSLMTRYGLLQPVSIIDQDYSGQPVYAPVYNPTDNDVLLKNGERICQVALEQVFDVTDWERSKSERTEGGFGSTGR